MGFLQNRFNFIDWDAKSFTENKLERLNSEKSSKYLTKMFNEPSFKKRMSLKITYFGI